MQAAFPLAVLGRRGDLGERLLEIGGRDTGDTEAADARRVDQRAAAGEIHVAGAGRRVAPAIADRVDLARRIAAARERVGERCLADARVPGQHRHAVGQGAAELVEALARAQGERDDAMAEGPVELAHPRDLALVVRQVDLRERQHRLDAPAPGGHQVAIDQPRAQRRIGHGGDDHEHVDVGRDDLLLVAEGTAQEDAVPREHRLDAHRAIGQLAHLDPIADDGPRAPQAARDGALPLLAVDAHDDELVVHPRDEAFSGRPAQAVTPPSIDQRTGARDALGHSCSRMLRVISVSATQVR